MVTTGFRFNPTDEELAQILYQKALGQPMALPFIVEENVYKHEPQDLQWDHVMDINSNERYYYCKKNKYSREVTGLGWWKATSHVKTIIANDVVLGYKRPLTFHRFKDNSKDRKKGIKTNWIMHEYSLTTKAEEWRLCKIKYKGKLSLTEEIGMDINGATSSITIQQPQPLELNDVHEAHFPPNTHLEVITESHPDQPQPSYDAYQLPSISTDYNYFWLEQPDLIEQPFSRLWTWHD